MHVAHVAKTELVSAEVGGVERPLRWLYVVGEDNLTTRPFQREADETDAREELCSAEGAAKWDDL